MTKTNKCIHDKFEEWYRKTIDTSLFGLDETLEGQAVASIMKRSAFLGFEEGFEVGANLK